MKRKIIKPSGKKSELKGFIKLGETTYLKSIEINATNCCITENTIEGELIIKFDELDFDDLIEIFDDGFNTLLFHVQEGECDNV